MTFLFFISFSLLALITSDIFVHTTTAISFSKTFGYHCTNSNEGPKLKKAAYEEIKQTCEKIPVHGDLPHYKFSKLIRHRYYYGVPGPCGRNQIFVERLEKSNCGICVCNDTGARKLIYHPIARECYYILEQGFCPNGHWIALNQTAERLDCQPNPCYAVEEAIGLYQVPLNGKCVELYAHGRPTCKKDEHVGFELDNPKPVCTKLHSMGLFPPPYESEEEILPGGQTPGGGGIFRFDTYTPDPDACPNGQQRSITGRCVKTWRW